MNQFDCGGEPEASAASGATRRVMTALALAGALLLGASVSPLATAGTPGQDGQPGSGNTPGSGGHGSNHGATNGSANDGGNGGQAGQGADGSGGSNSGGRGGDFGNLGVGGGGGGGANTSNFAGGGGGGGGGLGLGVSGNSTISTAASGGSGGDGGAGAFGPGVIFPGGNGGGGGGGAGLLILPGLTVTVNANMAGGNGGQAPSNASLNGGGGGGGIGILMDNSHTLTVAATVNGGAGGDDGGSSGGGQGGDGIRIRGGSTAQAAAVNINNGSVIAGQGGKSGLVDGGDGGAAIRSQGRADIAITQGRSIQGGNGGAVTGNVARRGGHGGQGISVDVPSNLPAGNVSNHGNVRGGHGLAGGAVNGGSGGQGGRGGDGAHLINASMNNGTSGILAGGNAGAPGSRGSPAEPGVGLRLGAGSIAVNLGSIRSGNASLGTTNITRPGHGGHGAVLASGVEFSTFGSVSGGMGGRVRMDTPTPSPFAPGNGGHAIVAGGNTVVRIGGEVSGGARGTYQGVCNGCSNTAVMGNAVLMQGGNNHLILEQGYLLEGNAVAGGSDALILGGDADAGFDLALLGSQYLGFGSRYKQGNSTWTLSGSNGASWSIEQGGLRVDGSAGAVTVVGGQLQGAGSVAAIALRSGGTLAPGNGVGAFNGASLTWDGGGVVDFELGSADAPTHSDRLLLSGNLVRGQNGVYRFRFRDGNGSPAPGSSRVLIEFAGSSGFQASDFSFEYAGSQPSFHGHFVLTGNSLQFVTSTQYTVGGSVSDLTGNGLVLDLNGQQTLPVAAGSTSFVFPEPLDNGSTYLVTASQQPAGVNCLVVNGQGVVAGGNVTSVMVLCSVIPPELTLTVDNNSDHVQYNELLDYVVTLHNASSFEANGISLTSGFSPALVQGDAQWQCLGAGGGAVCTASGSGGFSDSGVVLPAGHTLTWVITVPVQAHTDTSTASLAVDARWNGNLYRSAWDNDPLVLFRDGFEGVALNAGEDCAGMALDVGAQALVAVPALTGEGTGDLMLAMNDQGDRLRIDQLNLGGEPWLRLRHAGPDGGQSWSGWQSAVDDTCLGVAVVEAGGQSTVVLHGLGMTRELALPATPDPGAARFRIVQAHGGCGCR